MQQYAHMSSYSIIDSVPTGSALAVTAALAASFAIVAAPFACFDFDATMVYYR